MSVRLNGSTSGYVEIDSPAVGDNSTCVLPTGGGTLGRMVLATAQNTTSGTAIDFTGIPSWVKRITVMFNGVSTSGSSKLIVQLGTSTGFVSTGYAGVALVFGSAATSYTTGFGVDDRASASGVRHGLMTVSVITANTWTSSSSIANTDATVCSSAAGTVTLSATLDRVRITTINGTDTFDAGSVNILYEG